MISEFFFQIAELKKLPRSGWKIKVGLKDSESVCRTFLHDVSYVHGIVRYEIS